jgi:hypothetical protein
MSFRNKKISKNREKLRGKWSFLPPLRCNFEVKFFAFDRQKTAKIFLTKKEKFEEKNRNFYCFLVRFKNKNRRKNN